MSNLRKQSQTKTWEPKTVDNSFCVVVVDINLEIILRRRWRVFGMGIFTVENDAVQDPVRLGYEGEPTAQHA